MTSPKKVCVAGATGTIGRAVVRECVARGYAVTALVRSEEAANLPELDGADVRVVDLSDASGVEEAISSVVPSALISCIASRSGAPRDAIAVDLDANLNLLKATEDAGAEHFILLSAICVQKPRLMFQRCKLTFEAALKHSDINHTIVRPTAFFKSLSGQVKRVASGKPFLIFGDGELTRCKPISDRDLAGFIADALDDPGARGAELPIGGPGPAITLKQQGELMFELAGKEARFQSVPVAVIRLAASALGLLKGFSPWLSEKSEYASIAHYYATESMLYLDPETGEYSAEKTPEYGTETLRDHYARLLDASG